MLNYKRLVPRSVDPKIYTHNNEKITHQEADMINNGTFIEGETSVSGEYITAQEVVQKLAAQHKHVNYMIGGDELNELVCYYTWSSDTIDPTGVYIPDLDMTVEDRRLLAYEITPENADVTSAVFSIVSGSDIAHIDGSYVVADHQGTATYKVVVNGSIEDTATITVSNKPEEFPDDAQHRWIRVQPESSQISVDGGTIHVTGSYGLTGSYGTEKKVGDITDTIVIESNSSQDQKSGSKTYYYNNNQFDTPTAEITWTQPGRSEEFPDDEEHRWIEVSPTQFTFPADGGSVDITGSYGLTGTFGTRKKVGDITDTITVDANVTASSKSGSKTYYYNNDQSQTPTVEVSWTQPNKEEEFPEEWTYVFEYSISDTNGGSSTGTSWNRQYYANGQEINYDDDFILNGITSYRTKTGTLGTVQKENVQYSGQIGRPSGYNYSDRAITQSGQLVQEGSNKQLQWSYTQEANVKVWGISADPTSLHFEAAGGTQSVSVTTWYTWQTNDNNNQRFGETTTEEQITAEANTSTQQKEWTETITKNGKSVSIRCTQDKVDTTQLIVPKFSTDGNTWTTTPMVLSWEAENTNALTYYYRVEVITKNASTGEIISTTNLDNIGYTIVNQNGDHFNASINGNRVTVRPISANTSYTDTIKTILFITPLGKETNHEFFGQSTFIHQYKGVKVENADIVVFTFGWNTGKDLDCATYVNDHVIGNENKYAGWYGYAGESNRGGNEYLMFAGDNRGTGKEYTCVDFNALARYIERYADDTSTVNGKKLKESFIDGDGNFVITIDIYNNWFNTKDTEAIELNYSTYNYTQKSIIPNINSNQTDKTFTITGATLIKTNLDNAICHANYGLNYRNIKGCYTKTAEFVYYLNSGQFYIKTNKDNVSLWNKGFSYEEDIKDYNTKYSSQISFNDNINYSVQIDSINLPKTGTSINNYLSVGISNKNNSSTQALFIYFPEHVIQSGTTFPKTYSDSISILDLKNKVLERIQNDDDDAFKSNAYIDGVSGRSYLDPNTDLTVPERFKQTYLDASNSIDLNIKIN